DNGVGNPDVPAEEQHSRAVRYQVDLEAMTVEQLWDSTGFDEQPYLSTIAGDADQTPGGKVLVVDSALQPGPGFDPAVNWSRLRELGPDGVDWSLTTDSGSFVYRGAVSSRLPGQAR
ncbi:MAG: aryl-sulfate sulfotransferase, partial [Myxococcales bacterium]|nr:aryl-sulfate sulfotransferase [Myxococcales bacterium]